MVVTVSAKKTI